MPLSPSHLCNQIQPLLQDLSELHALLGEDTVAPSPPDAAAVQRQVAQLQQRFQQTLAAIAETDLTPAVEQRLRPHQTEAHRRLRLLGIEAMRLQAAKQVTTVERQRSQIQAHTQALQQFIQAMADEIC